jgi:hypothetical protein
MLIPCEASARFLVTHAVDEEQTPGQRRIADRERLGVVGRGIPATELLHAHELDHDDSLAGRQLSFGHVWPRSADDVPAAVTSNGSSRQLPVALLLGLVQRLELRDRIGSHPTMIPAGALGRFTSLVQAGELGPSEEQ